MVASDPQLKIRVPVDVKEWLASRSRHYASSIASEIVRCVRKEMERETETAGASAKSTPTA